MRDKKMNDELKEIYKENVEWLNFAELKNGALLAISGVLLQIIFEHVDDIFLRTLFIVLYSLVIVITSVSFIPFLNSNKIIKWFAKKYYKRRKYKGCKEASNIIFYVNIFLSSEEEYIEKAVEMLHLKSKELDDFEKNYIKQLFPISTIVAIKYFLFDIAMRIFALTVIAFAAFCIIA